MKTWTQQADGSFTVEGTTDTRRVRLGILRDGRWSSFGVFPRAKAERVIADAIAGKHATAEAYRLEPIADTASGFDSEARERLAAAKARKAASQWRAPTKARSEAAARAWETRRHRQNESKKEKS